MTTSFEARWLDYAWRVATCPPDHKRRCEELGAARSGSAQDGHDLRWPGYLGKNYRENFGVLCVGHVHGANWDEPKARGPLEGGLRGWIASGRGGASDRTYLETVRNVFEWWLPTWTRWKPFRRVLDTLGDDVTEIAWTNFAKCRVPEQRNVVYRNPSGVVAFCQRDYPITEVVAAIRPLAVLTCIKNAYEGGPIVRTWKAAGCEPLVFTWHGLHGTDRSDRRIGVWSKEAAAQIAARRRTRPGA